MKSKDTNKFILNVFYVIFSNICTVLSGVLIGFILPKILGVSDYGYYKTFTLYASYIGILHFGFIDGIYLFFAGKRYEELNKRSFRTYTRFLFLLELCVSVIFIVISCIFLTTNKLIVLFVVLNIFPVIMTSYYEFITQITMRFKLISIRSIIKNSISIISIVILFILYKFHIYKISYWVYILIFISINYLLCFWYVYTYREITFGKANLIKNEFSTIISFIKIGLPLLVANLIAQLIFIVDQQFVNIFFSNEEYSTYAFAYSMINLITSATSAISTVLFPTLKKMDSETVKYLYSDINSYLLIFVSFCIVIYYPLYFIVERFLKDYFGSLITFRIILPGVLISSCISVIKYNCYKKFNMIKEYFFISIFVLFLAIIADFSVYRIFGDTYSISFVSIFVLYIWYIVVELFFSIKYKALWVKNFVYMTIVIVVFYVASFIPNIYVACLTYILLYFMITILFFWKIVKKFAIDFIQKFRKSNV